MTAKGTHWSSGEIKCLIEIWADKNIQLDNTHKNAKIFGLMREYLHGRGYNRTTEQCRAKVKKLRHQYLKARDAVRKCGSSAKEKDRFVWYDAVDRILGPQPKTTDLPRLRGHAATQTPVEPISCSREESPCRAPPAPPPRKRRAGTHSDSNLFAEMRDMFSEMDRDFNERERLRLLEQREYDERVRREAREEKQKDVAALHDVLRQLVQQQQMLPARGQPSCPHSAHTSQEDMSCEACFDIFVTKS